MPSLFETIKSSRKRIKSLIDDPEGNKKKRKKIAKKIKKDKPKIKEKKLQGATLTEEEKAEIRRQLIKELSQNNKG